MHSFESLYNQYGFPNYSHYFWRIRWFNTPSGVIVIAQENEYKDVTLTNLTTGQKVVAFHSLGGFNSFDVVQDASGKITLSVDMSPFKMEGFVYGVSNYGGPLGSFLGGFLEGLMGDEDAPKDGRFKAKLNEEKIDDVAEYISLNSSLTKPE
jgi:hypothetical protein